MMAPCCYQGPRWHLVVTKVTDSLHDAPLFLLSLNLNDTKVPVELGANRPVVELLHQLVLDNMKQLVGHLANHLGLNVVKHQLVVVLLELELVEPPVASGAHGQEGTCSKTALCQS